MVRATYFKEASYIRLNKVLYALGFDIILVDVYFNQLRGLSIGEKLVMLGYGPGQIKLIKSLL